MQFTVSWNNPEVTQIYQIWDLGEIIQSPGKGKPWSTDWTAEGWVDANQASPCPPPLHPRWLLANPGLLADTVGVCPAAVTLSEERGQGQWEILWPAGSERSFSAKPSGWSGAVSSVHQSCSVPDPRETWPSESKGLTTDMIISSPFVLRNFSVPVVTGAPSRWWWKIYTEHPRQAM